MQAILCEGTWADAMNPCYNKKQFLSNVYSIFTHGVSFVSLMHYVVSTFTNAIQVLWILEPWGNIYYIIDSIMSNIVLKLAYQTCFVQVRDSAERMI